MEHKRKISKRWVYSSILTIWSIWISGVFGNSGVLQAYSLSQVKRDMVLRIRALENEKQQLRGSLHGLEHDSYVQELTIRESLGFVRSNELVFEVP